MLSYFDDDSLSVVDIRNHIVLSHFDFAISIFKRYAADIKHIIDNDSTAIKKLLKCVY
jgi:hypothetical protein